MEDRIFDNAPLVELIAEVKWQLVPIAVVPGGGVDPFHVPALAAFRTGAANQGYSAEEVVAPQDMPRELLAGQITNRFRRAPNRWPLLQLGPGIFAANVTPPYEGWQSFRMVLHDGLRLLEDSYPASQLMKLSSVKLQYVSAFTAAHSRKEHWTFLREGLGVSLALERLPDSLASIGTSNRDMSLALKLPVSEPAGTDLIIKIDSGANDNVPATILQLFVEKDFKGATLSSADLRSWFDRAHENAVTTFLSMLSDDVRKSMGPSRLAGEAPT